MLGVGLRLVVGLWVWVCCEGLNGRAPDDGGGWNEWAAVSGFMFMVQFISFHVTRSVG